MLKAKLSISPERVISPIDPRLYGSFIEHMGRAVYTGIYEPEHPAADKNGFRKDVADLIRPLDIPVIRYPGGNFLSGYRWEDGVGPKESRPVRAELAWQALEPNQIGTNEFMDYLALLGDTKPMLAVNLGTGTPQDAANLLEYCNFPSGTHYSDLRVKHGFKEPHGVKLWCLGNEMDGPWQICAKTAEEYGRAACEAAKMMKWLDPGIELIACGSSYREMPTFGAWERTVLRHTYEHVDYLSLHTYYANDDGDIAAFLANNARMDSFIKEVGAICDEIKAEKGSNKDIKLSFDEWNVWYHYKQSGVAPPKWTVARPIEEELYDFADALLVGSMLITLINNSDRVKLACLAQLVNTLAPIMTEPGGSAWVQTTYYPFLYTSRNGRGAALAVEMDSPRYSCRTAQNASYIDCAAVLNGDELTLFLVNKHLEEDIRCEAALDMPCEALEWVALQDFALSAVNTRDEQTVRPIVRNGAALDGRRACFTLNKASWNMIKLRIGAKA